MNKFLMMLLTLLLLISSVFAADTLPISDPWWKILLAEALKLAFVVLTLVVAGAVTALGKKWKFEGVTDKINDVLRRSTNLAEQWALKQAKLTGVKPVSDSKMGIAIDFAKTLAKEYKLVDKAENWWEQKIESWLNYEPPVRNQDPPNTDVPAEVIKPDDKPLE